MTVWNRLPMKLRLFSQACGGIAVIAGLLVLSGWGWGISVLQSLIPGFPAAQPMTAVAMALGGGALLLQGIKRTGARRAAVLLASAVVAISLLSLAGYAGLDLGQDRWLFSDRLADQPGPYPHPGRMAEMTALCFLLVAFATAAKALRRMLLLATAAATVAFVLATMALLAYLFDVAILAVTGFSVVSLPTAAVLVVLSAGALAAEPLRGWPRRLMLDTPGGNLARVLLPLALIVPIGIGAAARIASRVGFFPPDFRLVIVCAVTAVLLAAVVIWAARWIDGLDAARQRYRQLYEAQPTAHLVLAPDLTIEEASAAYLAATMTRRQELVGKGIFEAFPDNPADPTATGVRNLRASLDRVLKNRAPDRMPVQKYDIRRPNGEFEVRWWAPLNTPVFGPDGEVQHIIHQVEDVTVEMLEREAAAEARAGEARFRAVADAIPGLVFETDPAGSNTYVNEQYRAYTGLPVEALLGDGWRQVFHPDDRERAAATWRAAVGSARPIEMECRIRRADGVWRWFMLRTSALRDAEGRVIRGIGVCTDIDDAKRAEAALRASEAQFRSMADSLPQLAWMADAKGWIYWYNRRWYEYTGTILEEMEGWGWRRVHHPDHVDRVVARIQRAWDTGESWEDTFPLRGADGQYRWFLSRAVPIRDSDGRVMRWFGTNTDVTDYRNAQEELQELLIREISHRVKNSLSIVSSLLQLQARTLEAAPRRALEDASARVSAVATVHDQLWREADASEVDLASFLSNLAAAIATAAPRHATVVNVEPAAVSADLAVPLGLLVNELVTNAYKYAYVSGEEGEVRVDGKHVAEGRYRIEVSDAGRGLPSDFDPGRSRASLGMRIVTRMAAQLNGALTVSPAEPGTRFRLEFPLKASSPPTDQGEAGSGVSSWDKAHPSKGKTVDDTA